MTEGKYRTPASFPLTGATANERAAFQAPGGGPIPGKLVGTGMVGIGGWQVGRRQVGGDGALGFGSHNNWKT